MRERSCVRGGRVVSRRVAWCVGLAVGAACSTWSTAPAGAWAQAQPTPSESDSAAAPPAGAAPDGAVDSGQELSGAPLKLLPVTPAAAGGRTAQQVVKLALATSPQARIAQADADYAATNAGRAYSLFLPRLDLTARYTRQSEVPDASFDLSFLEDLGGDTGGAGFGDAFGVNLNDRYSLQANLRLPISEYFLNLLDNYRSVQKLEQVGRMQRDGLLQDIALNAKRAYFELALAVAGRNLSEHRVDQLGRFTAEIRTLVDGGELGPAELAQARVREASAKVALRQAVARERIAAHKLRRLTELKPNAPVAIGEPLLEQLPKLPADLPSLVKQGVAQRPDAQALRMLIQSRRSDRSAKSKERLPVVALFGTVNYDNPNQRLVPPEERFYATWVVGAEVTWSPTELAVQNTQLDEADLEVLRARTDLEALEDQISIDVTTAYENAHSAAGAVEATHAAVLAAQDALDVRMALFHGGEATSREVLDAELDLRVAQLDYVDNVLAAHQAQASLQHATGTLVSQ